MEQTQQLEASTVKAFALALSLLFGCITTCQATENKQPIRPSSLLRLSAEQFALLGHLFEQAYQKTDFSPTLTNSYFAESDLYELVAIPVVQTPFNSFRLELFSHIYDPKYSVYTQLHKDSIYHGLGRRQLAYLADKSEFAVGLGFVAPLSEYLSLKTIISNHDIPGYGDSKFSLGFEFKY
ncbi:MULTISPECIES: hypothetical protein [unclassified Agarivorans]|uniref:hypothetical protein n=1 Tax=unclassified Agarivorans TaxID=2636026 RepID=UPI003D7DF315